MPYYSRWFWEELQALPPDQQKRIVRRIASFERKGWSAAAHDGDVLHLDGEIWEFRVLGTGAAYRLLFFPLRGVIPRVVVLTSCLAKGAMLKRQRLQEEVARAERRRVEWPADRERR